MEQLAVAFAATQENVAAARGRVVDFVTDAGAGTDLVDDCRIAVTEAFTNAVLHAYDDDPGSIDVEVSVDDLGGVCIAVMDDGVGWREDSSRRQAGQGMGVIRTLSTRCDVSRREGGGTEVRMWLDGTRHADDA